MCAPINCDVGEIVLRGCLDLRGSGHQHDLSERRLRRTWCKSHPLLLEACEAQRFVELPLVSDCCLTHLALLSLCRKLCVETQQSCPTRRERAIAGETNSLQHLRKSTGKAQEELIIESNDYLVRAGITLSATAPDHL